MLKKRGVQDVSQLRGGIHRYLEEFGEDGFFKGLNFVFDQRVAMSPSQCHKQIDVDKEKDGSKSNGVIIGTCIECAAPFDEISGSRICTVCRDLVLVCPACQSSLREYHCQRHRLWKNCYFTFLEIFDIDELAKQKQELEKLRESFIPPPQHRNSRKTLSKQIEKISKSIADLQAGSVIVDRNAPRRCRTCYEPSTICDGLCWGFWKRHATLSRDIRKAEYDAGDPLIPIYLGDKVEPGPCWNEVRFGPREDGDGYRLRGVVVQVKPWGAGDTELNCVAVSWDNGTGQLNQLKIYRWGVLGLNGSRLYDLQKIDC